MLAVLGWFLGGYGFTAWVLLMVASAALFGFWYPALLSRVIDQHKNLARQVGDESWNGVGKVPLADICVGILLILWIVMLGMGLRRYPLPDLLRASIGSLCVCFGLVFRTAFTAITRGSPAGPLDPDVVEKALKALSGKGKDRGRRGTVTLGLVVAQAACGQVMLGGTFGHMIIDPVTDLYAGSLLLSAAGVEMVLLLLRHRLLPVADRVATLKQALRPVKT